MSTNVVNRYQAFQPGAEGERNEEVAPPPAYNPDAVVPSDYPQAQGVYGSVPHLQQSAPGTKPPLEIHQPANTNVHYVNQHGEPVVVIPPQYPPQTMVHVQPQAQPKSALIPTPYASFVSIHDYRNPSKSDKKKRYIAAILGLTSCVLLVYGISLHQLAAGSEDGYDYECNVFYLHTDNEEVSDSYAYYSQFCLDDEDSWENWEDTDSSDWCETWQAAMAWICCVVFGCVMTCLGSCWVQPLCIMDRCCCPKTCPRICYLVGLTLCILANVLWTMNDKVCLDEDGFDLDIGSSVYLVSGACVVIFFTICCAK